MDKEHSPTVTQEFKPVKPRGPDETLEPAKPAVTETQPFILLKDRPPTITGEDVERMFEEARADTPGYMNDPEFLKSVADALQGAMQRADVVVKGVQHLEGNLYRISYLVGGKSAELTVERKAPGKTADVEEHALVDESEL